MLFIGLFRDIAVARAHFGMDPARKRGMTVLWGGPRSGSR
jgi:hypothetical protein